MDAVAMSVNVLIPGWNWTCAKLGNCLSEREWLACVNPSLVQTEVLRVSKLSRCGELEVHVGGEVVCLCRSSVEVVNDGGSGGRLKPVGGKTNVVNASVGGLPVCLSNACEGVSFTCVRKKSSREEDASFA